MGFATGGALCDLGRCCISGLHHLVGDGAEDDFVRGGGAGAMKERWTETIEWVRTSSELPDEDMTVLALMENGDVEVGYLSAGQWRGGCHRANGKHKTPVAWALWPLGEYPANA